MTKKEIAKLLYINNDFTQKNIAEKIKVTENTIGKWVKDEKWDEQKKALSVSKTTLLKKMYAYLETILDKEEGSIVADRVVKITRAIERLQDKKASFENYIEVFQNFTNYVSREDIELAKIIVKKQDEFVREHFINPQ